MNHSYKQWIDAHWPNEKPRIIALWDERARLQARITEIENELLKYSPATVEPFLFQFAVERREGDEG
jgi:hypothetical protein